MADSPKAAADDSDLIRRIDAGDRAAFEVLYSDYYSRLFRFIYRVTRRLDCVEELIHETLLVVWERPDGFDFSCKPSTWIFGIAYRKALKFLAKSSRYDCRADFDEIAETLADLRPTPAQQVELQDWLNAALGQLPPGQRAVVELTFHHGMHYREIAQILGCPENTVKTRMFHARKKLQDFSSASLGGRTS